MGMAMGPGGATRVSFASFAAGAEVLELEVAAVVPGPLETVVELAGADVLELVDGPEPHPVARTAAIRSASAKPITIVRRDLCGRLLETGKVI
jgi:hypothetical protein